jgi:hypothetical protein
MEKILNLIRSEYEVSERQRYVKNYIIFESKKKEKRKFHSCMQKFRQVITANKESLKLGFVTRNSETANHKCKNKGCDSKNSGHKNSPETTNISVSRKSQ